MRIIRGMFAAALPPCALTIGNFDGLHRGHAAILTELRAIASARALHTAVLTFEPHPREYFSKDSAPTRLSSLREKLEYLQASGVDFVIVQRFDARFAALDAHEFRDEMLPKKLGARHVLVGDDFRFGTGRNGDFAMLSQAPAFEASHLGTILQDGERVSSTAVRNALAAGQVEQANTLLGRPYSISGRVMQGQQLGRQLGFPTANIRIEHNRPPLAGVFVVDVHDADKTWHGVANIGNRPTVAGQPGKPVLEVHLFDFSGDLYRRHLRVDFLHKLRNEAKFPDLASLKAQITLDCNNARAWHAHRAGQPI